MALTLRLRFPELLESKGITPWGLHKQSNGRITAPTAYRLVRKKGALTVFPRETLEALCDVLGVTIFDLFEHKKSAKKSAKKASKKATKKVAKKSGKKAAKKSVKKVARKKR